MTDDKDIKANASSEEVVNGGNSSVDDSSKANGFKLPSDLDKNIKSMSDTGESLDEEIIAKKKYIIPIFVVHVVTFLVAYFIVNVIALSVLDMLAYLVLWPGKILAEAAKIETLLFFTLFLVWFYYSLFKCSYYFKKTYDFLYFVKLDMRDKVIVFMNNNILTLYNLLCFYSFVLAATEYSNMK